MDDSSFVGVRDGRYDSSCSVGLWTLSGGYKELWKGKEVVIEEGVDMRAKERPTSYCRSEGNLYLGLNTGVVEKIVEKSGKVVGSFDRWDVSEEYRKWDKHGSREKYQETISGIDRLEFLSHKNEDIREVFLAAKREVKELIPNRFGLEMFVRGGRDIRGLVEFKGRVYDAGSMGLFETDTGKMICPEDVSSVNVWNNMLCYVPVSLNVLNKIKRKDIGIPNSGSFCNALTGGVLVDGLTPFDGSEGSHSSYAILGDTVYVHSGNHPDEKITQRDLRTGEKRAATRIPASHGFVSCGEEMFDIRTHHDKRWIARSGEEDFERNSILGPERIRSAVSYDSDSILAAVYNDEQNTDIVRVSSSGKRELIERVEGLFRFM